MRQETFKKEIEVLRTMFIDDGIYDREKVANMLGISKDTYDKTKLKLADQFINEERFQIEYGRAQLKYSYHKNNENFLMMLYRSKSLKKAEVEGLALTLKLFFIKNPMTIEEVTLLSSQYTLNKRDNFSELSRSSTERYINLLCEAEILVQISEKRPYRFALNDSIYNDLSEEELMELLCFVDYMAATMVPSAPGYFLRDTLKLYLDSQVLPTDIPYEYQYNQFGRVLDEALALDLMEAITNHRNVHLTYYPVRTNKRYIPTGKSLPADVLQMTITPVQIIYDEHLSRWYLIAKKASDVGFRKFRLDYIVQATVAEEIDDSLFNQYQSEYEELFQHSWLVGTGPKQLVQLKFTFHPTKDNVNFIKNRVKKQGRFGKITMEKENYFIYEIEVNDVKEMKPWIRSFGSSVEVLQPQTLREEIIQDWQEVYQSYESISKIL